jgi:hypothetical protein
VWLQVNHRLVLRGNHLAEQKRQEHKGRFHKTH